MPAARDQLNSIQSMLAAGHRSVHLERHTLLLLGFVGGFLALATGSVITADRFPDIRQRALALLLWLAFWLGGLSLADHWLTRRARLRREEAVPFAQAQITRAWWMLLAVGILGSFGLFLHGRGDLIHGLGIVLVGLGIYLFGLFSRPLIEWIGLANILLGVLALASLPYATTRLLSASCFAIGMPLTAWLAQRVDDTHLPKRLIALAAWIACVIVPALLLAGTSHVTPADTPAISLGAIPIPSGESVVRVEPGTHIPLRLDLDSPILGVAPRSELDLVVRQPIEVALHDGQPDGRFRFGEGTWHVMQDSVLQFTIDWPRPRLEDGVPILRTRAALQKLDSKEGAP
jgi:hypothetical protein